VCPMRGSGRSAARGRRGIRLGFLGGGFVRGGLGKREEGAGAGASVGVVGNQRTNREWVLVVGGGGKALVRHTGDDTGPVGNGVGPR
jgi:hypothetical protein